MNWYEQFIIAKVLSEEPLEIEWQMLKRPGSLGIRTGFSLTHEEGRQRAESALRTIREMYDDDYVIVTLQENELKVPNGFDAIEKDNRQKSPPIHSNSQIDVALRQNFRARQLVDGEHLKFRIGDVVNINWSEEELKGTVLGAKNPSGFHYAVLLESGEVIETIHVNDLSYSYVT